jgi:hypothetical protein
VFSRTEPPSLPALADEAFNDLVDEMDEMIIAALVEEFEPAAGPVEDGGPLPTLTATTTLGETVENPSTVSASPAS